MCKHSRRSRITYLLIYLALGTMEPRRPQFNPWVGKIPWRRERQPTPVFWPGEFHGLYSSWGHKESDTTERLLLSGTTETKTEGSSYPHDCQLERSIHNLYGKSTKRPMFMLQEVSDQVSQGSEKLWQ